MHTTLSRLAAIAAGLFFASPLPAADPAARELAVASMKKAATFFRKNAASHGGYVYYYSPDFTRRLGEGKATAEQIWVQPPGTPTVGLAYLRAFEATRDPFYLDAAREAAEALVYGQLASGGWTNSIDFDPRGSQVAQYRNGRGRGRNFSTLDDGITPAALRLLMHADRALGFKHREIHEASEFARTALRAAQFAHGGFPQVWDARVAPVLVGKAQFPDYDWRTENRLKEYWNLPTLNDDLALHVADALLDAWKIYRDERCRAALAKLGDFLLLAQLPEPQPGWAQQYDLQMRPVWARKFEPPAVAGRESLGAISTLLKIHALTRDAKYLEPIPRALVYLQRSLLPDGQLARYYELQSNRPLYLTSKYQITHDDSDLPEHYGWKIDPKLPALTTAYTSAKAGAPQKPSPPAEFGPIIAALDAEGRWVSTHAGERLVGNPKFQTGERYLASEVFSRNLEMLSAFIAP